MKKPLMLIGALWCAGCNDDGTDTPVAPPLVEVERETCDDNPYLVGCRQNTGIEDPVDVERPRPVDPEPGPTLSPAELARAQAQNILLSNCGGCHGSQLTPQTARAGMNFIDDIQKLADAEKLIPLNSSASPIIRRMRDGSMPPDGERVRTADIDFVADFIDNPDYWPGAGGVSACDNPTMDFDQIYDSVVTDLRSSEGRDRPFLRYVSLANRTNAGVCTDTSLDTERHGLIKMLNMLSINARIYTPVAVDREKTLYRIDLRQVDWDREIEVDGDRFDDVWEAIIDRNPYAVPFVGNQADDAREDTGTDVPVMFLDSMLDSAVVGNLYYAIIDVDIDESLDDFIADRLGIDVEDNLAEGRAIRAGTTRSRISRQDRLVERHDIEVRSGVLYQSFDFEADQTESIFSDPFGFAEGGREAIFTLPNGMLAYLIADADGNLVEDSDILLDTNQSNFRALTSVSCSNCHASGFIPLTDEVNRFVTQNARTLIQNGLLNRDELDEIDDIYLTPTAFANRLESDSQRFYLDALERADLPIRRADPVSRVFLRFDRDMTATDAAGDLGVSTDEFLDELRNLEPVLGVLRGGTIDRDDFTAVYVASLCVMSVVLENRPKDDVCDRAFDALD